MAPIDLGEKSMALKQGPLAGIRVIEFAGIGPGPMLDRLQAARVAGFSSTPLESS